MCTSCGWEKAALDAEDNAENLPEWKTRTADFLMDVAATIREKRHVTERQLEVIESSD